MPSVGSRLFYSFLGMGVFLWVALGLTIYEVSSKRKRLFLLVTLIVSIITNVLCSLRATRSSFVWYNLNWSNYPPFIIYIITVVIALFCTIYLIYQRRDFWNF